MTRSLPFFFALALALGLSSCNQKEFDTLASGLRSRCSIDASYTRLWYIPVPGGPDWQDLWNEHGFSMSYSSLLPEVPGGLRAVVYDETDGYDFFNLPPAGGVFDCRSGSHYLLLYNNDTEYIVFNDLADAASAMAATRSRTRAAFAGSPYVDDDVNGRTVTPPDMLFACNAGSFTAPAPGDTLSISCRLRPLVYKYILRYHFDHGLNHVSMARGALAGMAAGVFLADGRTTDDQATFLFDIESPDSYVILDSESGSGVVSFVLNSFGVPACSDGAFRADSSSQGLNLEVLLSNGASKSFDFDVSSQLLLQPCGGVIDVFGLAVDDSEVAVGQGSFQVDVSGWSDYIEIPFL